MSVGSATKDAQLVGSDFVPAGGADVTATRVASCKTAGHSTRRMTNLYTTDGPR
jgi:hypothetical protein